MYDKIIEEVLKNGAKKATHFITNKEIIRVVRTSYSFNGKFSGGNVELTITRGKPNYQERELAKKLSKATDGLYPPVDKNLKIDGMTFFKYLPKKKKSPKHTAHKLH